jgi:cytoskeletal protein CcmA (bactofilin family)
MIKQKNLSIIGLESKLEGKINFNQDTIIYGTLEGELTMSPETILRLEIDGRINGELKIDQGEILGVINGSINCHRKLTIYPTAIINGPINAGNLVIYPGAQLNSKIATSETPLSNQL